MSPYSLTGPAVSHGRVCPGEFVDTLDSVKGREVAVSQYRGMTELFTRRCTRGAQMP